MRRMNKGDLCFADGDRGSVVGKRIRLRASSGRPFRHAAWGGSLALDLLGMRFGAKKMPILYGHDGSRPVGFFGQDDVSILGGLEVQGTLVDTPSAKEFFSLAQNGYPWQASLYGIPTRVEKLKENERSFANGVSVEGPGSIWRDWTLKEVSVCSLGADGQTSASAFAFGEVLSVDFEEIQPDDEDLIVAEMLRLADRGGHDPMDKNILSAEDERIFRELLSLVEPVKPPRLIDPESEEGRRFISRLTSDEQEDAIVEEMLSLVGQGRGKR